MAKVKKSGAWRFDVDCLGRYDSLHMEDFRPAYYWCSYCVNINQMYTRFYVSIKVGGRPTAEKMRDLLDDHFKKHGIMANIGLLEPVCSYRDLEDYARVTPGYEVSGVMKWRS